MKNQILIQQNIDYVCQHVQVRKVRKEKSPLKLKQWMNERMVLQLNDESLLEVLVPTPSHSSF